MMQTTTTAAMPSTDPSALFSRLLCRPVDLALAWAVKVGRLLRLLPQGADSYAGPSFSPRPRPACWRERGKGYVDLHAVLGRLQVVVSLPRTR